MTGFGSSASVIGEPDAGLMDFTQMSTHAGNLASCIGIPLIADGDTGYGNAINVYRTVKTYAKLGVAAIHLEDQLAPKRCGHVQGKVLIPLEEMVGKLHAAKDAAAEQDIVIIARTDARAVEGFQAALERCKAFEEAGADVIFLEAPRSLGEMRAAVEQTNKPMLANMVEGVSNGYSKSLEIVGVGSRAQVKGKTLVVSAGYSHPVEMEPPDGITFKVENNTKVIVSGIDKELVGNEAAKVRAIRPPEPYKGKGIKYEGERILRKAGKSGKK